MIYGILVWLVGLKGLFFFLSLSSLEGGGMYIIMMIKKNINYFLVSVNSINIIHDTAKEHKHITTNKND